MTKIFKQLARHWAVCLVVFALLFVQAYCDLALPDYTSKIVDTGIQQGGIESPLPQTLRKSTLDTLSLLMSEEDAQKLQNAYQYYLQDDGVLQLRSDLTEDERTALEDAVTTPDIVLYMAAAQAANTPAGQNSMGMTGLAEMPSATADTDTETVTPTAADLDTICSQFAAMSQMPGFDRSMLQKQLDSAMSQMDSTLLENLKSQSLLLVQLEYEAQGVARNVQMGYLFRVGGQMLALTLLMVVVAVAVGFLASRVSAAIGRDLRRETFSSVIGFSNAEIENFSTASLITRTTNDIQQVQFVCVILLRMVAYAPILGIGGVLHVVGNSSGLSWIVVLDVALLLLLLLFLMSVAMPKFKVMQQLVDRLNLVSREILTGIMPVRAFSREKFEEQRFDKANRELMGTQLFTNRAMVAMMPFMTLIMNGTSLLIVWFGGKAMDAGTMQVGSMIAFIVKSLQNVSILNVLAVLFGIILIFGGPMVVISLVKLYRRNMARFLEANACAVNRPMRLSRKMGAIFTFTPPLPASSLIREDLVDIFHGPIPRHRLRWTLIMILLCVLALAATYWFWGKKYFEKPEPKPAVKVEAPAAPVPDTQPRDNKGGEKQ